VEERGIMVTFPAGQREVHLSQSIQTVPGATS